MKLIARGIGTFFRIVISVFLMIGLVIVIGLAWLDDIAHGRKDDPRNDYYGPLS